MTPDALAAQLQQSAFGQWASGALLVYPVANVAHLIGLVMLIGAIGLVDLRVIGFFRALPLAPTIRAFTPIAIAGFLVMLPTGAILFAADAVALIGSTTFRLKLILIAAALANVMMFRWAWPRHRLAAGLAAAASLLLWLSVLIAGRMIAYS